MGIQTIEMKGIWTGTYQHESKRIPEARRNQRTQFRLQIDQFDGTHFSGTIEDDTHTGGTRGVGRIEGQIKGNCISFIKQMPVSTAMDPAGNIIEEERPHRKIYYSGELQGNTVTGQWKFKFGIGFFQKKLALFPAVKGNWEMTKEISINK